MNTGEMTCTEVLEELGRLREYHQERADQAAQLEEGVRSVVSALEAGGPVPEAPFEDPAENPAENDRGDGHGGETKTPRAGGTPRRNAPPELGDISVDFTGTSNIRERVHRVAVAARGTPLSPTVVTRFLIESGQHTSNVTNLRPQVYRAFRDHPELYQRVGNGCFSILDEAAQ